MIPTLVGLMLGAVLAAIAFRVKQLWQDEIFFAPYRACEHVPKGGPKAPMLLGILEFSPNVRQRERTALLHQPLVDPDLDRRRYRAWLLEGVWAISALVFMVASVALASSVLA